MSSDGNYGHNYKIAVLLPCYNEAIAIGSVVAGFRASLPQATIYVYDNNSTDNTAEVAAAAGAIVRKEPRQGKGNVLRRMFADIEADIYVLADGDGTYDAEAAPSLITKLIYEHLDFVNGSRVSTEVLAYRRGHKFGNVLLSSLVSNIFGHQFNDMLSGYKVFSRRFVKSFPALSQGFETETELAVHALELRMPCAEVATRYGERPPNSTSKLRTYRDGFRILMLIAKLVKDERPLLFFGLLGLLSAAIGMAFGLSVIGEYLATGLVPRLPTAVLSIGLVLTGLISIFTGMMLDMLTLSRREMKRLAYLSLSHLEDAGLPFPLPPRELSMPRHSGQPAAPRTVRLDLLPAALLWVLAATGLSVYTWWRGQDINYDLLNYHWFTVYAALSPDPFRDIAGLQQFLNPYLYLPHHLLNTLLSPFKAAVALTWLQALNIPLLYVLSLLVLRGTDLSSSARRLLACLGAATGLLGPIFLTETGTSFADTLASIPILAGLCLLLPAISDTRKRLPLLVGTGLLIGLSVGFKLTNAGFAIGAIVALIAIEGWRHRALALAALGVGGAAGGALAGGYWSFRLWSQFGSPIFPFYNSVFKSPFYPPENTVDQRFLPTDFLDALSYPFQWVIGLHPSSEQPFRDLRFALLTILLVLVLLAGLWRIARHLSGQSPLGEQAAYSPRRRALALVLFSLTSYTLWIAQFAIQRYLVPIELIAGPTLMALLILLRFPAKMLVASASVMMIAICLWTRPSNFDHSEWTHHIARTNLPSDILNSDAIVFLLGDPTTYIIPEFGEKARFFNIGMVPDTSNSMGDVVRAALDGHKGPIYTVQGELMNKRTLDFLNSFNLRQDGIDCLHFGTWIGGRFIGLGLCPVTPNPRTTPTTAMTYPLGRTIEFAGPQKNNVFYAVSGWSEETDQGRVIGAEQRGARIHFEIAETVLPPMQATMAFAEKVDRCALSLTLNGKPVTTDIAASDCHGDRLSFPVEAETVGPTGEFDLSVTASSAATAPMTVKSFVLAGR